MVVSPLSLALSAVVLRLILSAVSWGTNDIDTWFRFGQEVLNVGLGGLYERDPLFNHPPLMGLYSALVASMTIGLTEWFPFAFRLPGILAEGFLVYALAHYDHRSAKAIAWNPILILVSGYHGNTDPWYGIALVVAILLMMRAPTVSGLLWAFATQIKLVPLLTAPLFLLAAIRDARSWLPTAMLAPMLWIVALISVDGPLFNRVFGYTPTVDFWGLPLLASSIEKAIFPETLPETSTVLLSYAELSRWLLVAGIFLVAWGFLARKFSLARGVSATLLVFLLVSPVAAPQYFAAPIMVLALCSPLWAWRLGSVAAVLASTSYLRWGSPGLPLRSIHEGSMGPLEAAFGFMLWVLIVVALVELLSSRSSHSSEIEKRLLESR